MDKHRIFQLLRSWTLAWGLAWGTGLCLASGVSLEFPRGMWFIWCCICLTFTLSIAKSGPALLLIPGILGVLAAGKILPVCLPGCLAALGVCRTVLRQKGLCLAVASSLAPLGLCLAKPGSVPAREGIFLLLLGTGVLIVSHHTRYQHPRQGNRLAAATAPVLAAALGLILVLNPPESYVNHSAAVRDFFSDNLPIAGSAGQSALAAITTAPTQVVLRNRPQTPSSQTVMTVTSQETGKLYLRERSYDCYDGSTWSASEKTDLFTGPPGRTREVTISTRGQRQYLFAGYYPKEPFKLTGGASPNTAGLTQYTLTCTALAHSPVTEEFPVPRELSGYLALPEATLHTLLPMVCSDGSASEKARKIGAYLRQGTYTLYPEDFPKEGEDFVISFLDGTMEGSCTHFAAAAAVLLRASGVPARLTAGYLVDGEAGREVAVTEKDAHAWVEFYEPGLNTWLILDPTPPIAPVSPPESPAMSAFQAAESGFPFFGLILGLFFAEALFRVRMFLQKLSRRKSSPNRLALSLWQEAQRLSRLLKQPVSGELATLARKACFSTHQLSEGELSVFYDTLDQLRRRVKKKYFLSRLVLRWVYGVY